MSANCLNPVIAECWQRMEQARQIIARSEWREGLPNAWCHELTHLRRHIHIPTQCHEDWEFLTNEMARGIESKPDNIGMQFLEGISESEVRDAYYAFRRVYCCIANLATQVESMAPDSLQAGGSQEVGELYAVCHDLSFRVH